MSNTNHAIPRIVLVVVKPVRAAAPHQRKKVNIQIVSNAAELLKLAVTVQFAETEVKWTLSDIFLDSCIFHRNANLLHCCVKLDWFQGLKSTKDVVFVMISWSWLKMYSEQENFDNAYLWSWFFRNCRFRVYLHGGWKNTRCYLHCSIWSIFLISKLYLVNCNIKIDGVNLKQIVYWKWNYFQSPESWLMKASECRYSVVLLCASYRMWNIIIQRLI